MKAPVFLMLFVGNCFASSAGASASLQCRDLFFRPAEKSSLRWVSDIKTTPANELPWRRLLEQSVDEGSQLVSELHELGPWVEHLSPNLRQSLLRRVAELYENASKNAKIPGQLGSKRTLDLWIRILLPNDKIFAHELQRTRKPLKAFQRYLDTVARFVTSKIPASPRQKGYGIVSAKDLLAIAKAIQLFVRSPSQGRDWLGNLRSLDSPNAKVFIYGSLMKGLARDGSDLDLLYEDIPLSFSTSEQIRPVLLDRLNGLNIHLDSQPHFYHDLFPFIAQTEPFAIEIGANEIYLLVTSLRNRQGVMDGINWIDCENGINCLRFRLD